MSDDFFVTPLTGLTDADGDGAADNLVAGENATGEYLVTVTVDMVDDDANVMNTGTDSGFNATGDPRSDSDTATVTSQEADLSLSKGVDNAMPLVART